MSRPEVDLVGRVFGRLTVLEKFGKAPGRARSTILWRCRCDCGELWVLGASSLRNGTTSCGCARPGRDLAVATERFWAKVDRSGGPDACWPWLGSRSPSGYGQASLVGKGTSAHRVAWELARGPLPKWSGHKAGLCVLHRCDMRDCVNPAHLFLGTAADNSADKVAKGRQRGVTKVVARQLPRPGKLVKLCEFTAALVASSELPRKEIASLFGISPGLVSHVRSGRRWPSATT